MNLYQWAIKHQVSLEALDELRGLFGLNGTAEVGSEGASESAVQTRVRLEAAAKGVRLFRNNVGVLRDETGRPVRYGLANDSKSVNDRIKSADLIGIRPVLITPSHLGSVVGVFVSREIKAAGWKYSGTDRETAQLKWAQMIAGCGGDACFATGEGTL